MRRRGLVGLAMVLLVGLASTPALAQDPSTASPDASPATPEPASVPSGDPSATPAGTGEAVLDPDGIVVTNDQILQLQREVATLEDEAGDIAASETTAQRRAARARQRLVEADDAVTAASEQVAAAGTELDVADRALERSRGRLTRAERALDRARDRLADTDRQLDEARLLLQRRLRSAWMHGGQLSSTSMVLGMEDFNDVARVQHLLQAVVAEDNQVVADYLRLQLRRQEHLEEAHAEELRVADAVEAARTSRDDRAEAAGAARRARTRARVRQDDRVLVLAEVEGDLANLSAARLDVEERLDRVVADLELAVEVELDRRREQAQRRAAAGLTREEARAARLRAQHQRRVARASAGRATEDGIVLPESGCGSTSLWVWPTEGCVTSAFGLRDHPILRTRRLHAGLDIPAPAGTPILAVADGTVHRAGPSNGGHGNVVVVDHGEVATLYAHQRRVNVRTGQQVVAGQVIGWVGSTGLSTGPHLHLETHIDGPYGTPVDPAPWFR